MDKQQIELAIRKINTLATYARDRILNDTFLKSEYAAYLSKMSWPDFMDVFRDLQMTVKDLPSIAEIKLYYNRLLGAKQEQQQKPECVLCHGSGWVKTKLVWEKNEYDQYAHCICATGQCYAYDFSKAEDPKMRKNLRVACISEIVDIEKLKSERNRQKHENVKQIPLKQSDN